MGDIVYNILKSNNWEKDFGYYIYRKFKIEKPPQRKRKKPTQKEIINYEKELYNQSEEFDFNEKYFTNLFKQCRNKYNYNLDNMDTETLNFQI